MGNHRFQKQLRNRRRLSGSAPVVTPVALPYLFYNTGTDERVSKADGFAAYCPARVVEGYTGNTYRAQIADSAANGSGMIVSFGFDADTGKPDYDSLLSWAGSEQYVIIYDLIDQLGNEENFVCEKCFIIEGGNLKRLGTTDPSESTGQITRVTDKGGLAWDLGDDRGHMLSGRFGWDTSGGLEMSILHSSNERKTGIDDEDGLGGNDDIEYLFSLGQHEAYTTVFFRNAIGSGSNNTDFLTLSGSTGSDDTENGGLTYKQYAQQVSSFGFDDTNLIVHRDTVADYDPLNSTTPTDIANGDFDDTRMVFGSVFSNNTTGAIRTTNKANVMCGGIFFMKPMTPLKRFFFQSKVGLIGQEQYLTTKEDLLETVDDVLVWKNTDSGTGQLVSENGDITIQVNQNTHNSVTPDVNYDHVDSDTGLPGIQFVGETNEANFFEETGSNYLAELTDFGIFSVYTSDDTSNDLSFSIAVGSDPVDRFTDNFRLGLNHARGIVQSQNSGDRDDNNRTSRRNELEGGVYSSSSYDEADNQPDVKYNNAAVNKELVYTTSYRGITINKAFLNKTNLQGAGWEFDTIIEESYDNLNYPHKDGAINVHFGHTQAPAAYDRDDVYATRVQHVMGATTKSFISAGLAPIGHIDGGLAINEYCAVSDGNSDAIIKSSHENTTGSYNAFEGVKALDVIKKGADLTLAQKNQWNHCYWMFLE